jgi:hypothetical protein
MPSLKTIGAFIITGLLAALGIFSAKAKKAKAERDQERQRADIAEQVNETSQSIDRTARELDQRHKQENIDAQRKIDAGDRNQLDSDW